MTLAAWLAALACLLAAAALLIAVRAYRLGDWAASTLRAQARARREAQEAPNLGPSRRSRHAVLEPEEPAPWEPQEAPEAVRETRELPRLPRPGEL